MAPAINSIVFSPPAVHGGVKSLYAVCGWLDQLGRSSIQPFDGDGLADWFAHDCNLYDNSYQPDLIVYPEVFEPEITYRPCRICYALGQRGPVAPGTDLAVCRSPKVLEWVEREFPGTKAIVLRPGINRAVFEYDGRPKSNTICFMTKFNKHPETADLLREKYPNEFVEIVGRSEAEVAEILKDAKVFVWRGDDKEGSPRPPKEALVAGCIVVGLESDLNEAYQIDFGERCKTVEELVERAGQALMQPVPSDSERAVVRDVADEENDWNRLIKSLQIQVGAS